MEYLDIVNEEGEVTGGPVSRDEAHRNGIRHRTAHIWIVRNREGRAELLLQKRSRNKESFPGCWDISAAGHISAGDEPLPSAVRELYEELGISVSPDELIPIGKVKLSYEKEFYGEMFRDNEVAFQYALLRDVDPDKLIYQPEEVECAGWFTVSYAIERNAVHDPLFASPIEDILLLKEYLESKGYTI